MRKWFMMIGYCTAPLLAAEPQVEAWRNRMAVITPKDYPCVRTDKPIRIDGTIDEQEWKAAPWSADFVDIEGQAKPRPALRTRVRMLWDEENLYIAADLEEPELWASLTKHDSVIFNDPDFEVFVDPDGDTHGYGEFEMNALNTTWDLFLPKPYKDGGKPDDSWEIIGLKSAVRCDGTLNQPGDMDRGWTLEIAMPWKSLARLSHRETAPSLGEQWRINFSRVEWQVGIVGGKIVKKPKTPESNWVWSPQGVVDMHRPEMWGRLRFVSDAATGPPQDDLRDTLRKALMEVYYAERDHLRLHQAWAHEPEALGLQTSTLKPLSSLEIRKQPHGYQCRVLVRSGGSEAIGTVDEDGRLIVDSPR